MLKVQPYKDKLYEMPMTKKTIYALHIEQDPENPWVVYRSFCT